MRCDFEESIVAGYNEDARAEVNQLLNHWQEISMLKRYPCGQCVFHNIKTSISSSTPLLKDCTFPLKE